MARPNKPWWWKQKQCWYVTIDGKRIRLDEDREEAFRKFHARMAEKPEVVKSSTALVVLMDKFLDWTERNLKAGSYRFYFEHCSHFHEWLKKHRLSAIESLELKPYQFEEYLEDVSVGRRAGATQAVKRVYNWGVKKGLIAYNPINGVDKPAAGRRKNTVTKPVFKKMLKLSSDQNFKDLITFCWHTGCRPQEAWKLEGRHIDHRNQRLVIPKEETKRGKKARAIYCNDIAWEIVQRLDNEGHLFVNAIGRPWNKNSINNRFLAMKKNLGKKYALYDLRHTAISNMVRKGVASDVIAKLMGTSIKMIETHNDHTEGDVAYMKSLVQNL